MAEHTGAKTKTLDVTELSSEDRITMLANAMVDLVTTKHEQEKAESVEAENAERS